MSETNYGPLAQLIGTWEGAAGVDASPARRVEDEPDVSAYFETITFTAAGDVTNAGEQHLAVVQYHQLVSRKSDGNVFHNEVGFWTWDAATDIVTRSFTIPRGTSCGCHWLSDPARERLASARCCAI